MKFICGSLFLVLSICGLRLLTSKKLNLVGWFGFFCIGSLLWGFYNADNFKLSVNLKTGELLAEMQRLRDDVYAKVETVKKIGEETAELTAFASLLVGRYAPPNLQDQLLITRDRIASLLKEIGSDDEKIKAMRNRFTERIADDLRNEVVKVVEKTTGSLLRQAQEKGEQLPFDRQEVVAETRKRLETYKNEEDRTAFLDFLRKEGVDKTDINMALDNLDFFLKTGKLQRS